MIPGFGVRLREARLATGVRLKQSVSQKLMAQLVTEELGKLDSDKTVSQPQWSQYEAENDEPSLIVYRAVERVSGLPESYIAFGKTDEETGKSPNSPGLAEAIPETPAPGKHAPSKAKTPTTPTKRAGGTRG